MLAPAYITTIAAKIVSRKCKKCKVSELNVNSDTYSGIKCTGLKTAGSGGRYFTSLTRRTAQPNMRDDWESRLKTLVEELPSKRNKVAV